MKHGSLCTGMGGIDLALAEVLGAETAWVSDIDPGARKVLAHRFPDVPNIGDMTAVDWSIVEPVDVLSGGTPCQDLSHAGARKGMREGTRSNLWVAMREAIAVLRPSLVIWENVKGAYSACAETEADSELGPCPRCVDPDSGAGHAPNLRALGRVVGDLTDLGYDARWHGLRAADVGAPHGRMRVFLVGFARDSDRRTGAAGGGEHDGRGSESGQADHGPVAYPHDEQWGFTAPGQAATGGARGEPAGRDRAPLALLPTPQVQDERHSVDNAKNRVASGRQVQLTHAVGSLLPTPRATDGTKGGPNQRGSSGDLMLPSAVQLLPTPAAHEPGGTAERYHERLPEHDGRESSFLPLSMAVQLLPTPRASDGPEASSHARSWSSTDHNLHNVARAQDWGKYADAIARWEQVVGTAPAPTEPGRNGKPRLSARFTEWMQGFPDGWITDVPGITRNEALRLCGNGVVPQQCAAAVRLLLKMEAA